MHDMMRRMPRCHYQALQLRQEGQSGGGKIGLRRLRQEGMFPKTREQAEDCYVCAELLI